MATRKRKRVIEPDDATVAQKQEQGPSYDVEEVTGLMKTVYTENAKQNEHKRKHDSARKSLLGKLQEAEEVKVVAEVEVSRKKVTLVAQVATGTSQVVDVAKLKKLVSEEQFMRIVSATQKAIKEEVGESVMNKCLKTVKGSTNVSVKAAK